MTSPDTSSTSDPNDRPPASCDADFDEVMELVGSLCNDCLSATQLAQLDRLLAEREDVRCWYADYMQLHSELFWHHDSMLLDTRSMVESGVTHASREMDSKRDFLANSHDGCSSTIETNGFGKSGPLNRVASDRQQSKWVQWSLAGCLLLGATLGAVGWQLWSTRGNAKSDLVMSDQVGLGAEVARVTGTRDCRWENPVNHQEAAVSFGTRLRAGQRLRLAEGLAEITFERGTRIILEAPALLDVSAENRSVLHRGRLTAAVPVGAEGFQVEMDRFTLIDRGTEFGVMASDDGNTEVRVFDGLVEGHFLDDRGSSIRMVEWTTNAAVRVDARRANFVHAEGEVSQFVRSLSASSRESLHSLEEFDYPAGPLGGQNGGFGWGGPWVDISADGDPAESNRVAAGNLRVASLVQTGNHASIESQRNRIRRVLGTSLGGVFDTAGLVEDQDGVRVVGQNGSTVYLSFCQNVNRRDDGFYGLEVHRGDGNFNRVLCIGNGASQTGFGVTSEVAGGAPKTFVDLGSEPIKSTFFVVRFDFGVGHQDRIMVYRDPESLVREASCVVDAELVGNFAFDRISISNFDGGKTHGIDRIRIGVSFGAVTDQNSTRDIKPIIPRSEFSRAELRPPFLGTNGDLCQK